MARFLRNEKESEQQLILESDCEEAITSYSDSEHDDDAAATTGSDDNVSGSEVVDEVTVFFNRRVLFKQYIPKKHKHFGIKTYKLCDMIRYTYSMRKCKIRGFHGVRDSSHGLLGCDVYCSVVAGYQCFRGPCCLIFQGEVMMEPTRF